MAGRGRSCNMSSCNTPIVGRCRDVSGRGAVVGVHMAEQGAACMRADWRRVDVVLDFFDLGLVAAESAGPARSTVSGSSCRSAAAALNSSAKRSVSRRSRNIDARDLPAPPRRTGSVRSGISTSASASYRSNDACASSSSFSASTSSACSSSRVPRPASFRPRFVRDSTASSASSSSVGMPQAQAARLPRPAADGAAETAAPAAALQFVRSCRRYTPRRGIERRGEPHRALVAASWDRRPWPGRTRRGVHRGERRRRFPIRCRSASRYRQDVVPSATRRRSRPAKTRRPACSRCRR